MMKRVLGLYFPYLATDRLRASIGGSARSNVATSSGVPRVVVAVQAGLVRVVKVDARAVQAGLRPGMTLTEARAQVPDLDTCDQDSGADRIALESLALWADRFSPCVHLEGNDTLWLDMTGTHRVFSDEEVLLERVAGGIRELGYAVRAALADTAGAVWALTRAHPADRLVVSPGRTAAALAPLPVTVLRLEPATVTALESLGVETVEALLHLPRASLAARFGEEVLCRLDQALGDEPELLMPFRPPPLLKSTLHIGRTTDRYDVLREAVERVTICFCEQLERRVAGVRRLFLTFGCPEVRPLTFETNVSQATRSAEHLRLLLLAQLDGLSLPTGAATVMLWTRHLEPLDGWQAELFDTGRPDTRAFAELIDRLSNHLGPQAVVQPQPAGDHQPEKAYEYSTATMNSNASLPTPHFSPGAPGLASHFSSRPLRLLPKPVQVRVIAVAPEGPPSCFDWRNSREEVVDCTGPERLETGWWRGRHVCRDYFRTRCRSGRSCWLFRQRETGAWFLHGWFD